jgi:hypothetical protein
LVGALRRDMGKRYEQKFKTTVQDRGDGNVSQIRTPVMDSAGRPMIVEVQEDDPPRNRELVPPTFPEKPDYSEMSDEEKAEAQVKYVEAGVAYGVAKVEHDKQVARRDARLKKAEEKRERRRQRNAKTRT